MEFEKDIVVFVPKIVCTKDELLEFLCLELDFPSYFGFNWDALLDCLSDFSWLHVRKITIIHEVGFKLKEDELKVYKEILIEAIERSNRFEYPKIEFFFDRNINESS
jgi:RNAse (barnase) inhibitor barstar